MASYRLAAAAKRDLEEIWDYIAEDNPAAASAHIEFIISKFLTLAETPEIGRERPELKAGIRSLAVKKHVIFYREADDMVEIVRVLSGYRDLPKQFH